MLSAGSSRGLPLNRRRRSRAGAFNALLVLTSLLPCAAPAADDEVFRAARSSGMYLMERGSYREAEAEFLRAARASSQSSRSWMYKHAGDAAFLRGDLAAAHKHYALGIATRFERDLWITEENPGWTDAVAGERAIERAPVDIIPRMQGTPNEVAPLPRRKSLLSHEPWRAPKVRHSRELRRLIRQTSRALKSSAMRSARNAAPAIPVDPQERGVPGSGVARLMTEHGTCPAVRSTRGSYIASASCIARDGRFPATPWTLTHDSGLHPPDLCTIRDYWTQEGRNAAARTPGSTEEWAVLAVQPDCHPFFIELVPFIAVNRSTPPAGTGRLALVEYSSDYDLLVPVLRLCQGVPAGECTQALETSAAVWMQLGESTDGMRAGDWRFAGFAEPGRAPIDYSTSVSLVAALQKAWELGLQRRTQVKADEQTVLRGGE